MVHVLHITDTHLYAQPEAELYHVKPRHSLQAVMQHASQFLPEIDLVLVTGDLVHDETSLGYQALHELLTTLDKPVFYVPGNHDDPSVMQQILPNFTHSGFYALEQNHWSIVLLDSSCADRVEGELSKECLAQLDAYLESHADHHVLVALHHHVVDIQSPWLDALNLRNHQDFTRIVERYSQVKAVLNGHIHQELDLHKDAVRYLGTPSTCFQFVPRREKAAIDDKPPGYRYLVLGDDGGVDTQVFYVEGYRD